MLTAHEHLPRGAHGAKLQPLFRSSSLHLRKGDFVLILTKVPYGVGSIWPQSLPDLRSEQRSQLG